jgi:hypothetical protein
LEEIMPQRDTVDFVSAFAIGAVIGAALVLLLRPQPPSRTERIVESLKKSSLRAGAR